MLKQRVVRIVRLAKLNVGARKVFHTGALPAYKYGLEVTGATDEEVRRARGAAATIAGHATTSRDIWGAARPASDPLPHLTGPPILRYAEEWWRLAAPQQRNGRVLPPATLKLALEAGRKAIATKQPPRGPVGRALTMLKWVGWKMANTSTVIDREGHHWNMAKISPGALKQRWDKDVLREVEARANGRFKRAIEPEEGEFAPPWWEIVRAYQRSRETPLHKAIMLRAHSGTLCTPDQWRRWGYSTTGECSHPACRNAKDDPWHRATQCKLAKGSIHQVLKPWQVDLTVKPAMHRFLLPAQPEVCIPEPQDIWCAEIDGTLWALELSSSCRTCQAQQTAPPRTPDGGYCQGQHGLACKGTT